MYISMYGTETYVEREICSGQQCINGVHRNGELEGLIHAREKSIAACIGWESYSCVRSIWTSHNYNKGMRLMNFQLTIHKGVFMGAS